MTRRRLAPALAALALAATTSTLMPGCLTGGCTLVGCGAALQINITDPPEITLGQRYRVEVVAGGRTNVCTFSSSSIGPGGAGVQCDQTGHSMLLLHASTESATLRSIWVFDASQTVTVRVERDGQRIGDETFTPTYVRTHPNGVACGPACDTTPAATMALNAPSP